MTRAELFIVRSQGPEGQSVETLVARGHDGSFWMEPDYLELRSAEMAMLRQKQPRCVQTEPRSRKVLVEIRTAMRVLSALERQLELMLLAGEHLQAVEIAKPSEWDL